MKNSTLHALEIPSGFEVVETKNSLWEVVLSSGCYSDYGEDHYVFSGNSEEEVWTFVKLWAKASLEQYWRGRGLIYNGEQFLVYPAREDPDQDIDWDTRYGDAKDVRISRLEVIYVNP